MQILQDHRLVAINTWQRPAVTYSHPNGESQIDYILIRKQLADMTSKECKPLASPLAGWGSAGHFPLTASIKFHWRPWCSAPAGRRQQSSGIPELTSLLHSPYICLQTLQAAVKLQWDEPQQRIAIPRPKNVDEEVAKLWRQYEQRAAEMKVAGAWTDDDFTKHQQQLKKELRKLARRRKRDALLETLDTVGEAQKAGDMRQYQLIRRLCPKTYRRKLTLKTAEGKLMSNEKECEALASHARQLFADAPKWRLQICSLCQQFGFSKCTGSRRSSNLAAIKPFC